MKITTIRKNNYKWWNPLTWGKLACVKIEPEDLVLTKCLDMSEFYGILYFEGTLGIYSNKLKDKNLMMKTVERFLFPKRTVRTRRYKRSKIKNILSFYLPADTAKTACKQIMEILV